MNDRLPIARALTCIALTLFVGGLLLGFVLGVHVGPADCGVPFHGKTSAFDSGGACDLVRSQARTVPLAAMLVGLALLAGALALTAGSRDREPVS